MLCVFTGVGMLIMQPVNTSRNNWQKCIGESFFIGIFVVVVINNLSQYFELNLNQKYFFYSMVLVSVIGMVLYVSQNMKKYSTYIKNFHLPNLDQVQVFIFIIIIIHLYYIIEQNKLLPLTPWDAWSAWVAKSKIWYAYGINQLIVNQLNWFQIAGSMTNQTVHYPDGLSLLYVFNAGFFGWDEAALNSIYPAMFIAFLLLFYGNVKVLTNPKYAMVALGVLATLPFVNVHIILAGYADIWIGAFIIIILFNFQLNIIKKNRYNIAMVWMILVSMLMFKQESIVWICIILLTFILSVMNRKKRRLTYFLLFVLAIIWYLVGGFQIEFPFGTLALMPDLIIFPGLGKYMLTFVNTMPAWFEAMFYSKNWHLLWYSLPIIFGLYLRVGDRKLLTLPIIFLTLASMFLFVLFSMTYASNFANSFTSINRIVLHIVPVYIYFLAQVIYQYQVQSSPK